VPDGREAGIAFGRQVRAERAEPRIRFGIGGHGWEGIGIHADADRAVRTELRARTADGGFHHFRLAAIEQKRSGTHLLCKAGGFGHAFAGAQSGGVGCEIVLQRERKP